MSSICKDCKKRYECSGIMKSKNAYGHRCSYYEKDECITSMDKPIKKIEEVGYIPAIDPLMTTSLSKRLMDEVDDALRKSIEEMTFKTEPIPVPYPSFNLLPKPKFPKIKNVIFNNPATIVFWEDGTKTIVKCQDGDVFDPEKGLTMAISKKALGNKGNYCNEIKKWLPEEEDAVPLNDYVFHIPDPAPDHIVSAMENMKKAAERFWAAFKKGETES